MGKLRAAADSEQAALSTLGYVWLTQGMMADAAVDPSGARVAYPEVQSVYVRRLRELRQRILVGRHRAPVRGTNFDPEGKRLASVDTNGEIRVWSTEEQASEPLRVIETEDDGLQIVKFDPTGSKLVTEFNTAGIAAIWDLEGIEGAEYFELSSNGRTLAYYTIEARENAELRRSFVYDMETGVLRNLPTHEGVGGVNGIRHIAIDPTGTLVASGDQAGAVRVGPVTGAEPHLLLGHEGPVNWTAFSPDGKWVASAGYDQTVRLWPVPEGRPLHKLPHKELLEKLRSLTNMRVVPDEESSTGYRIDYDPFPGFDKVPVW